MDLKERLLQSEIHHLGQIIQTLSYELIVLQDFISDEFGPKFETFRKNYSSEESEPSSSSHFNLRGNVRNPTAGPSTSAAALKKEQDPIASVSEDELGEDGTYMDDLNNDSCTTSTDVLNESMDNFDDGDISYDYDNYENLRSQVDKEDPSVVRKGGRRKTRVWKYFDKVTLGDDKVSARCHNCNGLVSSRAARMVDHRLKCSRRHGRTSATKNYIAEIRHEVQRMKSEKLPNQGAREKSSANTSHKNSEREPKKIGRAQDVIWRYFKIITVNGQRKAKCLSCGDYISPKAGRLRHHKVTCEEVGDKGGSESEEIEKSQQHLTT